jgi:hypothetical protein
LSNGNGNKAGLSIAMLNCGLEGIGTTKLGVCDDQTNGPINGYGQDDEKDDTREQTGLTQSVRLTDYSGTAAEACQTMTTKEAKL